MTRILVVDDDAVVRVAVQNLASALGWLVDLACDVEQALLASLTPRTTTRRSSTSTCPTAAATWSPASWACSTRAPTSCCTPGAARRPSGGSTAYVCKDGGPLALLDHLEEVLAA